MKLLLAGMENNLDMAIKHGVKDILVSALYMHKRKDDMDKVLENFDFVFLDSGAFTFWNKWTTIWKEAAIKEYPKADIEDVKWQREVWMKTDIRQKLWDEHWKWGEEWEEKYLAMLKSDSRFLDRDKVHVVEFDVGNEEQMTARRKRFEREGFNVIPVFHPNDSPEYAQKLIEEYDYIGIGGIAVDGGRFEARHFQQYFKMMKEHNTKLHGFGMTQQEPMRKMPFYSVDSTSWLSGARFGTTYEFRNGQLKVHAKKDVRKRFKRACEELEVDYDKLLADDAQTVNEWNMLQWKQYGDWLTESPMKRKQEYWHDRVNGGEIVKQVKIDFDTWEKEITLINGIGELHDKEEYAEELLEKEESKYEELAIIEAKTELNPREEKANTLMLKGHFMECDSCTLGERCPLYHEGAMCRLPIQQIDGDKDFGEVMRYLFNLQQKRLTIGAMQESQDGGILDERLSKEMDRMMRMMSQFHELTNPQDTLEIKAKGSASGGILAQIFGIKD